MAQFSCTSSSIDAQRNWSSCRYGPKKIIKILQLVAFKDNLIAANFEPKISGLLCEKKSEIVFLNGLKHKYLLCFGPVRTPDGSFFSYKLNHKFKNCYKIDKKIKFYQKKSVENLRNNSCWS